MAYQTKFDMEASEKESLATKLEAAIKTATEGGASVNALAQLKDIAKTLHEGAVSLSKVDETDNVNPK